MLQKLKSLLAGEQKRFAAAPLIPLHTVGRPQWTPRNYAGLAKRALPATPSAIAVWACWPKRRVPVPLISMRRRRSWPSTR